MPAMRTSNLPAPAGFLLAALGTGCTCLPIPQAMEVEADTHELSARLASSLAQTYGGAAPPVTDTVVQLGEHTLSLEATIPAVTRMGDSILVQMDVSAAVDSVAVPALGSGSIGIGSNEDDAFAAAVEEWVLQYGTPISQAIWPEGVRDPALTRTFPTGRHEVVVGPTGIRGEPPRSWRDGKPPDLGAQIVDAAAPLLDSLLTTSSPYHAITLTLAIGKGGGLEGECRVDGRVSPELLAAMAQVPWPAAESTVLWKQYLVVREQAGSGTP